MNPDNKKTLLKLICSGAINCLTNSDFIDFLKKGTGFALKAGTAAATVGVVAPLIASIVNTVSGNLASTHFEQIGKVDRLLAFINEHDPEKLNHDLNKMIVNAGKNAFRILEVMYTNDLKKEDGILLLLGDDERKQYLDDIKSFFKNAKGDFNGHIEYLPIEETYLQNPEGLLSLLGDFILNYPARYLSVEQKSKLKDFYHQWIPYCFDLAFKEELKTNDRGYKGFQLWIAEDLKATNNKILANQANLTAAIERIENGHDIFPYEEMKRLVDGQAERIYELLETKFNAIREQLEEILVQIYRVYYLASDINNKVDVIARKQDEQFIQLDAIKSHVEKLSFEPADRKFLGTVRLETPVFAGRKHELSLISAKLSGDTGPIYLRGIGGMGKSTLAKQYIKQHLGDYDHIAWADVKRADNNAQETDPDSLFISAFDQIATDLNIDESATGRYKLELICNTLQNLAGNNILIIDNAGIEIQHFRELLPGFPYWKILITSRQVLDGFDELVLKLLSPSEAISLFKTICTIEVDDKQLAKVLTEIGGHTLTTCLLARVLSVDDNAVTLEKIGEKLNESNLDNDQFLIETKIPGSGVPLVQQLLNIVNLVNLEEDEIKLLKTWYFLLPGTYTVKQLVECLAPENDERGITKTLLKLVANGLITQTENYFEMHRLIRQVVYYGIKPEFYYCFPLVNFLSDNLIFSEMARRQSFVPTAEFLLETIRNYEGISTNFLSLFNHLGSTYLHIGEYQKVEHAIERTLSLYQNLPIEYHETYISYYLTGIEILANNFLQLRKNDDVISLAINGLELIARTGGLTLTQQKILLIGFHHLLGEAFKAKNDLKNAEKAYHHVLKVIETDIGDKAEQYVKSYATNCTAVARVYFLLGKESLAESHYLRALDIFRELVTIDKESVEPLLAGTLRDFGAAYQAWHQYHAAETVYLLALKIHRKLYLKLPKRYGADLALTLNNVGTLNQEIHRRKHAEDFFMDAMRVYSDMDQAAVPAADITRLTHNIGEIKKTIGDFIKAEENLELALHSYRGLALRDPGRFDIEVATTLISLGDLYNTTGKSTKAEASLLEALDIFESDIFRTPEVISKHADTFADLAAIYKKTDRTAAALDAYENAMKSYRELVQEHRQYQPSLARTLINLSDVYFEEDRFEDALVLLDEAITLWRPLANDTPGKFRRSLANAIRNQGSNYFYKQDLENARLSYSEAVDLYQKLILEDESLWKDYLTSTMALAHIHRDLDNITYKKTLLVESAEIIDKYCNDMHLRLEYLDLLKTI